MKTITIDCTGLETARDFHEHLARALAFPDWYGHNLDALFDCLMDIAEPTRIRIEGWQTLGDWSEKFGSVFADAGLENPELDIILC